MVLELAGNTNGNHTLENNSVTVPGTIRKVNQSPLTAHAAGDKVYGGSMTLPATGGNGNGEVTYSTSKDSVLSISGSTAAIVDVGEVTVTATKVGDKNHQQVTAQTTFSIDPKPVTVSITVADKVYNGTTTAAVTYTVNGKQAGDAVTASGTAAFADKNVGIGKTVNASSITLSGAKAENYILNGNTATTTANITAKALTWGASGTVESKTYDTTNSATVVTAPQLTGVFSDDTVSIKMGTVTFANVNAGTHAITATGFGIEGADSPNYSAPSVHPTFANGTIDVKAITPIVAVSGTCTFTGSQIKPDVTVKDEGKTLDAGDYTVTYDENVNVKTGGSVIVTLKGNYSSSATKKFTIEKKTTGSSTVTTPILMTEKTVKAYSISLPTGAGNAGTLTYQVGAPSGTKSIFSKEPAISADKKNLEFTSAAGTAKDQTAAVVITIGSDNYKDFTVTLSFGITAKRSVTLTGLTALNSTYDGTEKAGYQGGHALRKPPLGRFCI